MKILLLSAYDAHSHRQWRTTLADMFEGFSWTQLVLPPRHFNWRVRGNSLSWGLGETALLNRKYDLLIATSMVDLASLRGMVPALCEIPTLVYFHENQFTYPLNPLNPLSPLNTEQPSSHPHSRLDAQMVSIYTALCANKIVFNSHHNRNTFLQGVASLLQKLPDFVPASIMEKLTQSVVLPVPLPVGIVQYKRSQDGAGKAQIQLNSEHPVLRVVWNHRWEFDKGPELLSEVVDRVLDRKLAVEFFILGQQFRHRPAAFDCIEITLKSHHSSNPGLQGHWGYIEQATTYYTTLSKCDVVLSTALHDFQGLAILEATALGCTPLLPADLAYPEFFPSQFLYQRKPGAINSQTAEIITDRLASWLETKAQGLVLPKFADEKFQPENLKGDYLALFTATQKLAN